MVNPSVAILIPVHNGLEYTRPSLEKLKQLISELPGYSPVRFSLVVIDDGSDDGTSEWLREKHPEVTLLQGDGNLWWSGSVSKGARFAIERTEADYVLLWNNDIVPEENYFVRLTEHILNAPRDAIIGSVIYDYNHPDYLWSQGGIFNPRTGQKYMLGMGQPVHRSSLEIRQVDWLTGMGTLIPARVFAAIGYWNARYFPQYHGDMEFAYRATLSGFKNMVYPDLILYNQTENTAALHQNRLSGLWASLFHIKSKYNLAKDIRFYITFSKSPRAYLPLFTKYFRYIGGFFKWKLLRTFGVNKSGSH